MPGVGIEPAMAPMTTIAMDSLPRQPAGPAVCGLRSAVCGLRSAVCGVILTHRVLDTLPGHPARAGIGTADQGQVLGRAGFTDALYTRAPRRRIGMLVAAMIAAVLIGVRRPAVSRGGCPPVELRGGQPPLLLACAGRCHIERRLVRRRRTKPEIRRIAPSAAGHSWVPVSARLPWLP
ncbi:hypothetical protein QFZ32_000868 [Streptomyces canus]|nr:hypothetical protein [Streptomyces canus]